MYARVRRRIRVWRARGWCSAYWAALEGRPVLRWRRFRIIYAASICLNEFRSGCPRSFRPVSFCRVVAQRGTLPQPGVHLRLRKPGGALAGLDRLRKSERTLLAIEIRAVRD